MFHIATTNGHGSEPDPTKAFTTHLTLCINHTFLSMSQDFLSIPLIKIKQATNQFNEIYFIGSGGYATVYKANLDILRIESLASLEGKAKYELPKIKKTVAIKHITKREDPQDIQGFDSEIDLLIRCKHENIVSLLGFSKEDDEMVFVYEYAPRGSLSDCLESDNLTWVQRVKICLDVAHGINYLHTDMEGKPRIIHRDIKSDNILLDENLNAKVADFGLSIFHPLDKPQASAIYTQKIAGTRVYLDPEYQARGKYKRESDIYSFGVVLFEVLSGSLAYDEVYTRIDIRGLGPVARQRYNEGTLKELIDPNIIKDDDGIFTLNRGPNQASFDVFSKIASKCLTVTQSRRPRMEVIIKELQKALTLQGETTVLFKFRLRDIEQATKLFDETYLIGSDKNGKVYEAEFSHSYIDNRSSTVGNKNEKRSIKCIIAAIHRTSKIGWQERQGFLADLQMRSKYKHPNIACLTGICVEDDEIIFVYEHAINKSLDKYLKSAMHNLTWTHRLHICLEIAQGLEYLHTKMDDHVDINSANILLDKNCRAKIVISKLQPTNQEVISMKVYQDPEYEETTQLLDTKSDIYSFGVVLFEIFCGRLAYDPLYMAENDKGLAPIACQCFKDGTIERMIDQKLREERAPARQESLDTFLKVAYQCLGEAAERPTMDLVIQKLQKALNFQMIGVVEDI